MGTGLPAHERPWRPPRPVQPPEYLDVVFTPGTRFEIHGSSYLGREGRSEGDERALLIAAVSGIDTTVTIDVVDAGTLLMPTGRLVTNDTAQLQHSHQAFTVGVPPDGRRGGPGAVVAGVPPPRARPRPGRVLAGAGRRGGGSDRRDRGRRAFDCLQRYREGHSQAQ